MGYLEDVYQELVNVEAFKARSQRSEAVANRVSQRQAERLNEIAERYPHLSPDAAMAIARSEEVSDELADKLGYLSTQDYMSRHPNGVRYGQSTVTPGMRRAAVGQRRLLEEDFEDAPGAIMARDPLVALERQGIIGADGVPVNPVVPEYDEDKHEWVPLTPEEEGKRERFNELMEGVAEAQGNNDPIPFHQRGEDWVYYPETGRSSKARNDDNDQIVDLPGPLDELLHRTSENVREALSNRQLPTTAQAIPGQQATEGAGFTGNDAVRGALMAANAPVQEIQGLVRTAYGATHGQGLQFQSQSDFGIAAQGLGVEGAGDGFFVDPESEVAQERIRREAEFGQIGGHNVTLGRWIASPLAPDTKPFQLLSGLVDLGVQIADPSAWLLGAAGKGAATRRLFQAEDVANAAGLIRGIRNIIDHTKVGPWLDSADGQARITWLTETNSPTEVYLGLNRKVNFDTATELADTRTPEEVRAILEGKLGREIREVSTVSMPGLGRGDPISAAGTPKDMPARGPIDAYDKDIVGREIEKWLFNAKATHDEIVTYVDKVARAENPMQLNAAIRDTLRGADGILERGGIKDQLVRDRLTQLHDDVHEEGSRTWIDTVSRQGQTDDMVVVGGEPAWDTSAHLYVEHAPRYLTLPDARNVRRMVSRYSNILARQSGDDVGELRIPFATLEFLQNEIWKPVQLATRIAWPVRVIAEEQIRMAAAGYDSMFNHPLSFVSWRIGRDDRAAGLARKLPGVTPGKGTPESMPGLFDEADAHKSAMATTHGGWIDRSIPTGLKTTWYKQNLNRREAFVRAWASEGARLANDPVAQKVARATDIADVKTWFSRGGGNGFRADLARAHPRKFQTVEQADEYIDSISRRLHNFHGGNEDLIDAVRTGKFNDRAMLDGTNLDRKFVEGLESYVDDFAPEAIVGDELHHVGGLAPRVLQSWNRTVDRMFGLLMTNRTNNLSRSPTFRQEFWKEGERLIAFSDAATRTRIINMAKDADMGSRAIRRMERLSERKVPGNLTFDEWEVLAKGRALDATKELLYDMTRHGRFMDAARLVFPFGEAWKEVITRWFGREGLVWRNPKTIRRFQQTLQGARGEDLGDFLGAPEGEGFFWENQFGEQVFVYPGTQFLTDKLLGVPIPLTGRVQGLSMFGTVMPGLGPAMQIPVGWFAANKPGPQVLKNVLTDVLNVDLGPLGTVEEQILPFGSPGADDQVSALNAINYVPPWVKSMIQFASAGDVNDRQWKTSVMEVAGYLQSTGDYDGSEADMQRLLQDAERAARGFYFIKGLAGLAAPASPDKEWLVETNNGNLVRAAALAEELRELREADFDTADREFLDKYGEDLLGVIGTSMTTSANYATPGTKDGVIWVTKNPSAARDLPNTYGFFAPESGELDLSLYNDEFRKGERIRLEPETWIRLMNDTKGNLQYKDALNEVGDQKNTDEGRAYLRQVREWIWENYPGWRNERGELKKPTTQAMVDELYEAANHEATRQTDAGQGLRLYLEGRDEVLAYAESEGLAWPSESEAMADARAYLDELAQWVIERHPDFARVYEFVLSRETQIEEAG